jgi:hypothetical protein
MRVLCSSLLLSQSIFHRSALHLPCVLCGAALVLSVCSIDNRLALVLTDAIKGTGSCAKVIPNNVIDLMAMLYEYFARSSHRKKSIREFIDVENKANKQTRLRLQAEHSGAASIRDIQNPVDELERVMALLEERHKLPRKIVLTRWLSFYNLAMCTQFF